MATPAVSGIAALLLEHFRNLTLPAPSPALLKALLCNTAADLGNPGPDFTYGYGEVNTDKAVATVTSGSFLEVSTGLGTGQNWTHQIAVPAGCELRVLLAWSDREYLGASSSAATLVNDLDLELVDSNGAVHLPLTLNPAAPAALAVAAVNRRDNVEQVVIGAAAGGNATIVVKGFNVPAGPQPFAVTWCVVCPPPSPCPRQPIPGLFNTGLDNNGNALAPGAADPHYRFVSGPTGTSYTHAQRGSAGSPWIPDGPGSFWLRPGPTGGGTEPNGAYA